MTSKFCFERLPLAAKDLPRSSKQATAVPTGHFHVFKKLTNSDMSSVGLSVNKLFLKHNLGKESTRDWFNNNVGYFHSNGAIVMRVAMFSLKAVFP